MDEQIDGQLDIYDCIEIASLDALLDGGGDVASKYDFGTRGNDVVHCDDDEEPEQ